MDAKALFMSAEQIERFILLIRGQKVMLDADLARIYGVTTARLNQQVKRNLDRFPQDFMFQLTTEESNRLMLQNATSKKGRGGRRNLPYVFTEHSFRLSPHVLQSPSLAISNLSISYSPNPKLS